MITKYGSYLLKKAVQDRSDYLWSFIANFKSPYERHNPFDILKHAARNQVKLMNSFRALLNNAKFYP